MIKTNKTVVVEGKYDKIRLSSFIDANIIETGGFAIFRDKKKLRLLRELADKNGLIIITDSDAAGFKIRGFLLGAIKNDRITNVYIPDIYGKERRKTEPGKEGKLGVEGMPTEILEKAFEGAIESAEELKKTGREKITTLDLYNSGLSGKSESAEKRRKFFSSLGLPERLTSSRACDILSALFSREEFFAAVEKFSDEN